ncbi:MAG: TonB-dependent receptor [Pseudomonadales bacterium]
MKSIRSSFTKTKIATTLSMILCGTTFPVVAAEEAMMEEVVITGIRGSLTRAMDVKRNSYGVVDGVSAEDMGKFPDTNLAESLQRISGVSISRRNGEGAEVTIRGFGGDKNMVMLNGRMMPAASVYGGGTGAGGARGTATRAFDFANLASESVSSVNIYKTGRADTSTGGIGGTIDINTAKPLDTEGFVATVGLKAVKDTTNRTGDDITPELSGIFSFSSDDSKFGVALSFAHQERDSGVSSVKVNGWNIGTWDHETAVDDNKGLYSFAPGVVITNEPDDGQLYARPDDLRYAFSDIQRTRNNAQLVLQWAPTDSLITTLDYTYADNEITERRGTSTSWMANQNSIDEVIFDGGSVVASPLYISETTGPRDQAYEQELRQQTDTLKSLGFNLDWAVNDQFTLSFDAHNSTMDSLPTGPGTSGEIAATIGAPTQMAHDWNYGPDVPLYTMDLDDCATIIVDGAVVPRGNCNGVNDAGDVGSQVVRVFYADQTTEITQFKIDGSFAFDNGQFDFGIDSREMESQARKSDRYMAMGDWGIAHVGDIPDGLLQDYNLSSFDDYDTSGSFQGGFKGNAEEIGQALIDIYGTEENGYVLAYNPAFSDDNTVQEDTLAAYLQVGMQGELGNMPTNVLIGMRYEKTDVTSSTQMRVPKYLAWQDNNDFQTVRFDDAQTVTNTESYNNLLPSVDFDIDLVENFKARVSYSKTIARAGYTDLQSDVSNFSSGGGSTLNGHIPTADSHNPNLIPLESDNFDMSVEWYFAESAYVSFGVFEKRVKNFVGTEKVDSTLFGILDATSGPRAQQAEALLNEMGEGVDNTSLFVMTAILDNPDDFTGDPKDEYLVANAEAVAFNYDIIPQAGDPETIWQVSKPVNNKEAKIHGIEIAGQYFFGDSGFGIQANYTMVDGDIGYNDGADPSISQFALLGLSDTANLVASYEKYGIQARLGYNWRDEYLNDANRGSSKNPVYVEEFTQIDFNISYQVTDSLNIFAEGLNLTGENRRDHGRSKTQVEYLEDLGPRYALGVRFDF